MSSRCLEPRGRRQFCAVWDMHSAWSEPKEEPEPAEETEKEKPRWNLCSRFRGTVQGTVPAGGGQRLIIVRNGGRGLGFRELGIVGTMMEKTGLWGERSQEPPLCFDQGRYIG